MLNPQDNPRTPPPPSPSGSCTPSLPSTNLQPKKRRIKILARKTIASGELSKRLNAQLKAAQAQDFENSDDSFKSASEGEGPGSSNFEKAQNSPSKGKRERSAGSSATSELIVPAIYGVKHATVKESGKKSGESGSGEAVEGLVNLSSQIDEPSSSIEETLADLLKKVGDNYDPKKRRTPTPKASSDAKPSKKRKASSLTTTEIPLPKGRATKSRVKQSESELQKALAESKKKRMDKGKGKVAESSESVDVEEME
ncbi:uncharacterized protein [Nicotiana sylvestris]|uniref:uncharacterized protein n=1 Tax=Nicotiana sylvestris TaxID=4096 RepID=UPI00388C8A5C